MSIERIFEEQDPFLWSRLAVQGPASETFLQGQLSQDLVVVGECGGWSALLEPNSDVLATCYVRAIADGYELLVARSLGCLLYTSRKVVVVSISHPLRAPTARRASRDCGSMRVRRNLTRISWR